MILAGPEPKHPSYFGKCEGCPYGGAKCGSRGNPKAPIVFIGEAPGSQELIRKIPLVGPSGDIFWRTVPNSNLLGEYGFNYDDDVLILNSLQCRPPATKDAQKNTAAIEKGTRICMHRLEAQVRAFPRKLVVAMGNHALRSLTGNFGYKITQVRGQLIQSDLSELGLLPVLHPAALLRGTGNYRQFRADITYAFDLLRGNPPRSPIVPDWYVAQDALDTVNICHLLRSKPYVACDTETGGFNHLTDETLALGLCADPHIVYIIPEQLMSYTASLFGDPRVKFIWQNGKFDMRFMRRDVGNFVRTDEDTMLLSYALDEQGGIHDLEQIAGDLVGAPDYKHMLKPWLPSRKTSYRVIPKPVLYHYLALDTSNTRQIFEPLRNEVRGDRRLEQLYTRVLLPYSNFLYRIEDTGIMVRPQGVARQRKRLKREIDKEYLAIQEIAKKYGAEQHVSKSKGQPARLEYINPNSPQQLAGLLFDVLKMQPKRRGSRSTAKEVIAKLPSHPVLKALTAYRKAAKALSTYITSLERNINIDGRVHATYLIHGTRTGRLSSRGPNMQNIPRDPRLRGMYCAAPGNVFIKVDLNQAELRSLACLSGDPYLLELYRSGVRSLHKETVEEFFPGWKARGGDKHSEGVDELMRAKAVNFGVVYGRTPQSLADEFGISISVAEQWVNKWFARSPVAKTFIDKCRSAPANNWTLVTAFGRKKRHWIVTQENLQGLQNEASNFPHQSIASEICTLGGAKADPILKPYGINPVNVVHDEVMFECPDVPEIIAWVQYVIVKSLESIAPEWGITAVPFKAEPSVGKRWSIYRKGKEYEYPYTPEDANDYTTPNTSVLQAFKELAEKQAGIENAGLLEVKPINLSGDFTPDGGEIPEDDSGDDDWSPEDGFTAWGFVKTDGPDSTVE